MTDSSRPAGFAERCEAFGPDGKYGRVAPLAAGRCPGQRFDVSARRHQSRSGVIRASRRSTKALLPRSRRSTLSANFLVDKDIAEPCDTLDKLTESARSGSRQSQRQRCRTVKDVSRLPGMADVSTTMARSGTADTRNGPMPTGLHSYSVLWMHSASLGSLLVIRLNPAVRSGRGSMEKSIWSIRECCRATYPGGRASALNMQDGKISFIY